jgi:arylsulfatase A-like enzyme
MSARPNILYFVCHDLGRHLGCYGAQVATPNIDRFAAGCVKFTKAFCNSPACSPSRGCTMTGQYAHTNGLMGLSHLGWRINDYSRHAATQLGRLGYETIHLGLSHEGARLDLGYDIDREFDWSDQFVENTVPQAIEMLEQRDDGKKPFFLNIGTQDVHAARWSGISDEAAAERFGRRVDPDRLVLPGHMPALPGTRQQMAKFHACIEHFDAWFGRLMDKVEALGLLENTLVIFATDHGMSGPRAKRTLYDAGTEITLMARPPGGLPDGGFTYAGLAQNIDLLPTMIEYAGETVPDHVQGRSFMPLLTGGVDAYTPHDEIFTERNFHGEPPVIDGKLGKGWEDRFDPTRSIRTPRWHYIRSFGANAARAYWTVEDFESDTPPVHQEGEMDVFPVRPNPSVRPPEELYDIRADPLELRNLADEPQHASVKASLAARLDKWMRETDDFLPGDPPRPQAARGWGENWPRPRPAVEQT